MGGVTHEKIIKYIIGLVFTIICCFTSFVKSYGNYQDISGTVIAKSGDIKSRYKSTRVYTEYIFAIHPDNGRLSDFDIEVPFHSYVKFDVGDKIVFYDMNINKYLKDPKWYETDAVWGTIFVVLLFVAWGFLCCIGIECSKK